MKTKLFKHAMLCIATLFTAITLSAQEATFEGLGHIHETPGFTFSEANDVSYDGSVIVGVSSSHHQGNDYTVEAFRWTEEEGMVGIGGLLQGGMFFSYARAVSDDGLTIVGYSNSESPSVGWEAFRWTENEGMIGLGDLVETDYESEACDVSGDGSVIAGRSYSVNEAFRWENGEIQRIAEEGTFGEAWGVSVDGSVIVGSSIVDGFQQAFRWTEETGMVGLGFSDPYGMGGYSVALKVSGDGTTIVGFQQYNMPDVPYSAFEAFKWTEETGRIGLGQLSNVLTSEANDMSDDGSVIVGLGHAGSGNGWAAFVYTEETGMQNLKEVLETEYGLDLNGWILENATAISGDGTTIVGNGVNPDGIPEAWRAVLPAPLSVNEFSAVKVSIYPNPTTNILNLQTNGTIENLRVYNLTGQKTDISLPDAGNKSIDLSCFSSGMYFLEVTVDGQISRHKVIKK